MEAERMQLVPVPRTEDLSDQSLALAMRACQTDLMADSIPLGIYQNLCADPSSWPGASNIKLAYCHTVQMRQLEPGQQNINIGP